jgi:hypothetical protein
MDHERLAYPIAAALLAVTGDHQSFTTLVRSRLFQVGFGAVLGAIAWNIIGWFVTGFPLLPVLRHRTVFIGKGFPGLWLKVHPLTIAFGYFTKSEVLLSIWIFHLLAILQVGIQNRVGLDLGASDFICSFNPVIGWQSFGSMVVFVFWSLWIARLHLAAVFRKVFTGRGDIDDSEELISYRAAVCLLLGSAAYLVFWLHQAGMAWAPLLTFWFGTLVLYLGLARIIVESGLVYLRGPISAQAFTWHLFGITGMGPASTTALALTYSFFCDAKTFGMTMFAHIPRLGVAMNPRFRRRLVPAVLLAALVGAATVTAFTTLYGYQSMGAYNFGVVSFNGSSNGAVGLWRTAANRIQEGTSGTDWGRVNSFGLGVVFTGLLFALRYRFPRFPVHPIGFATSGSEILRSTTSSIFLVWLIKSLVLKFGGLETYRRKAPLFLGMALGYVAGVGLGVAVDVIWFNGNGHSLTGW